MIKYKIIEKSFVALFMVAGGWLFGHNEGGPYKDSQEIRFCKKFIYEMKSVPDAQEHKDEITEENCLKEIANAPEIQKGVSRIDVCMDKHGDAFFECMAGKEVRDKSAYDGCYHTLSKIMEAMDNYLADNNNLDGVDAQGEALCSYLLPGYYGEPDKCKGKVAPRVLQGCKDYTITVTDTHSGQYEITGHAFDSRNCCIVITEILAPTKRFNECSNTCPEPAH